MKLLLIKLLLSIILISFQPHVASADHAPVLRGHEIGNGGDVVVCYKPNSKVKVSVEMLDHYEARRRHQLTLDYGPGISYQEKVEFVIDRLEKINPSRARLYRLWWNEFEASTKRVRNITLDDIPDSGDIIIPKYCKVEQIAIQGGDFDDPAIFYLINEDLVDYLDAENHASLILHELTLREAITLNYHRNSKRSRYFNNLISSTRLETLGLRDYFEEVSFAEFVYADANGFPICVKGNYQLPYQQEIIHRLCASRIANSMFQTKVEPSFYNEEAFYSGRIYNYTYQHPFPHIFNGVTSGLHKYITFFRNGEIKGIVENH